MQLKVIQKFSEEAFIVKQKWDRLIISILHLFDYALSTCLLDRTLDGTQSLS